MTENKTDWISQWNKLDSDQTMYEKEHNIKVVKKEIVYDSPMFKIILLHKSSGDIGMKTAYKLSKIKDVWHFFYLYEEQIFTLPKILEVYKEVDMNNKKNYLERKNGNNN